MRAVGVLRQLRALTALSLPGAGRCCRPSGPPLRPASTLCQHHHPLASWPAGERGSEVWVERSLWGARAVGRSHEAWQMEAKRAAGGGPESFEDIEIERKGGVGVVTMNRPKSLNALSKSLMVDVVAGMEMLDEDKDIKVIVLAGAGKHFCAGADIKEMQTWSYSDAYNGRGLSGWRKLEGIKKPVIAAVHGVAFGGGCELAMLCDILVASEDASFSQPEVKLGIIPGMGGTQRLVRAVGKSKAMEMILTGTYRMSAEEACQRGLVSKVVPREELLPEALKIAEQIAKLSTPVIAKAKDCVNTAYRMTLPDALHHEQREFWSCFALQDGQAGLKAFVDKQTPEFKDC